MPSSQTFCWSRAKILSLDPKSFTLATKGRRVFICYFLISSPAAFRHFACCYYQLSDGESQKLSAMPEWRLGWSCSSLWGYECNKKKKKTCVKCEVPPNVSNVSCFGLLAQQCPFINVNKNVTVSGDPEEATYGNVLRFSCKSKLDILDGPSEIYCNEEGEWSGRAPKCIGKACRNQRMMSQKAVSEEQKVSAKYPAVPR